MRILLKNIIRNILSGKRRTLALILCMAVVAFSAMTAFSTASSADKTLEGLMTQTLGDAKIIADNRYGIKKEIMLPEGTEAFYVSSADIHIQKRSKENFIYPSKFSYSVIGMDTAAGRRKGFLPLSEDVILDENEIMITENMAKAEELSAGSTIDVCDADKNPLTLTVKRIVPNELFLKARGSCAIASHETVEILNGKKDLWDSCYIAVNGNISAAEAYEEILADNPDFAVENISAENAFFEIFIMLFGIFLILAFIIFVVTAGISEHIVRERMSQLGTLRSLGATKTGAGVSLIAESLFYGLIGAVLGILLYLPIHKPLMDGFIYSGYYNATDYSITAYNVLTVMLITVLLSCASPIKAILKAVKTPLRDIILGNRDTAYELKKPRSVIGAVLMILGALCGFLIPNAVVSLVSLVAFAAGLILFAPLMLEFFRKLMKKNKNPVVRLSFTNIATKKTIVDSTVLYSTVIGLAAAVLMLVINVYGMYTGHEQSGDIIIRFCSMSGQHYRFISALDEVEYFEPHNNREEFVEINGVPSGREVTVIGYDGNFRLYTGVKGLPAALAEDEVSLDEHTMNKLGIKEGDRVELTLNAMGERPIKLSLTAAKGCNTATVTYGMRNGIAINLNIYKKYFFDYPNAGSIKLKAGADAEKVKEKISTFLMDKNALIQTYEEYLLQEETGDDSIYFMLAAIIGIGCLLSAVLLVTNQSVGFEQRRKELAVLHSTAMSKAQLKMLLFCETAFSILIATVTALISGMIEYELMLCFVSSLAGLTTERVTVLPYALVLLSVMYLIALLTTTANGRRLKKMNTAEQIKYE